jgi:hypothetical protein
VHSIPELPAGVPGEASTHRPGFDNVTLTLANGETETGSLVSESATQIVLKRGDGTQATLDPKQIKRVVAPSSMPEIYGQMLTPSQLRGRGRVPAPPGRLARPGRRRGAEFGATNRAMQSVPQKDPPAAIRKMGTFLTAKGTRLKGARPDSPDHIC